MRALIVSDGKAGHENQSIAFCELLNMQYETLHVAYSNKFLKAFGYLFDWLNIYTKSIFSFQAPKDLNYDFIISCGSSTYYPAKCFAKNIKLVALMNPKWFKNNFFHIFASEHDNPKHSKNMTILPANISLLKAKNIYVPKKESVAIIIGGNNSIYNINKNQLQKVLECIKEQFLGYEIAITSSPRTPKNIEDMIEKMAFDYQVIYSKNKINPIPDFIFSCKYVFITEDSTSMISDAISNGNANIEIIELEAISQRKNKFKRFIAHLEKLNLLHIYNGSLGNKNKKINLKHLIEKAFLCK